jgi:hypothetical protein
MIFAKTFSELRHWLRKVELKGFIFLYLVFVADEIDEKEARTGSYKLPVDFNDDYGAIPLEAASDLVLSVAQMEYDDTQSRFEVVNSKVNALQTVAGIITSGVAGTVAFTGIPESTAFKILLAMFLLSFVITLWFVLRFLGVGTTSIPAIGKELLLVSDEKKQIQVQVREYRRSSLYNDYRNNYLVDVYKGAKNGFVVMVILSLGVIAWTTLGGVTLEQSIISKIRGNEELSLLLRGPEGSPGRNTYINPHPEFTDSGLKFKYSLFFNLQHKTEEKPRKSEPMSLLDYKSDPGSNPSVFFRLNIASKPDPQ